MSRGAASSRSIASARSAVNVPYFNQVLYDNPISYWRLGETSGSSAADVKGANNLTIGASVTLNQTSLLTGDSNPAMLMAANSTGYLTTSTVSSSAKFTSAFTLETWVKPTSASASAFLITGTQLAATPYYYLYFSSSTIVAGYYNGGGFPFAQTAAIVTTATQHLAGTFDGTNIRIYRNGALVAGPTLGSGNVAAGINALFVGAQGTNTSPLAGIMDEVAIYNTALSASRILAHYNAGIGNGPRLPASARGAA